MHSIMVDHTLLFCGCVSYAGWAAPPVCVKLHIKVLFRNVTRHHKEPYTKITHRLITTRSGVILVLQYYNKFRARKNLLKLCNFRRSFPGDYFLWYSITRRVSDHRATIAISVKGSIFKSIIFLLSWQAYGRNRGDRYHSYA
jgi:hypothetical protein